MSHATLPQTLEQAHAMIQQLQWRVSQLEKQLFGPTSDRAVSTENLSKEQVLLSLFPAPAEPPATSEVAVPGLPSTPEQVSPRKLTRTPAVSCIGDSDPTHRAAGKTLSALWEGQM